MQRSSTQSDRLQVICPLQDVTGEKVDISDYLDFGFHDNVSYKDNCVSWGVSQSNRDNAVLYIKKRGDIGLKNNNKKTHQPRKSTYKERDRISEFDS